MAKLNSYSFGCLTKTGCVYDDLDVLHSVLCKLCCINHNGFDFEKSFNDYVESRLNEVNVLDVLGDLRDMLYLALKAR